MPTALCTKLILRGLYHNQEEVWISEQPFLGLTYAAVYFPSLAKWYMDKKYGPQRVNALKKGESLYGTSSDGKKYFVHVICQAFSFLC
jgi:hypothetical protein